MHIHVIHHERQFLQAPTKSKDRRLFYLNPSSSAAVAACFRTQKIYDKSKSEEAESNPFWLSLTYDANASFLCGWLHTPRLSSNFDALALKSHVISEVERMVHTASLLANQRCALLATSMLGLCSPLLLPNPNYALLTGQAGADEW